MEGEDVKKIFGAMYDATKSDSCTITVIATGLEDVSANAPVQNRMGAGTAYRPPISHAPDTTSTQPGVVRTAPGIQKPADIRSNVQEKTLKIPDFIQRK